MNEATIEIPQNTEKLRDGFVDQAQKIISLESRIERLEAELRLRKRRFNYSLACYSIGLC